MRSGRVRHSRRAFGKDVLNALKAGGDLSQRVHPAKEFKDQGKKEREENKRADVVKHGEFSFETVYALPNAQVQLRAILL